MLDHRYQESFAGPWRKSCVFLECGIEVSPQGSFLRDELVSEVVLDVYLVAYKADHGYKIKWDESLTMCSCTCCVSVPKNQCQKTGEIDKIFF